MKNKLANYKYSDELLLIAMEDKTINFNDEKWVLFDLILQREYSFVFNSVIFGDHVNEVKLFFYIRYINNYSIAQIYKTYVQLKKFFIQSKCMTIIDISVLINKSQHYYAQAIYYYLNFINFEDKEFMIEANKLIGKEDNSRVIADISTLLEFDYYIKDFYLSTDKNTLIIYYPIVLWWNVCGTIPIRDSEFCLIKKDPIVIRNGLKYLNIPTIKTENSRFPEYSLVPISNDIEHFFIEYSNIRKDHINDYIFSRSLHIKWSDDSIVFNGEDLIYLLYSFIEKIICKQYNPNFNTNALISTENNKRTIRIGDLRHLAMYNAVLQGLDPVTIQELARHGNINSQLKYYKNLPAFVMGKINVLANRIYLAKEKKKYSSNIGNIYTDRQFAIKKITQDNIVDDLNKYPQIDNGGCSKIPPFIDCPGGNTDCYNCQWHLIKEENIDNVEKQRLKNMYEEDIKEIEIACDTYKALIKKHVENNEQYHVLGKQLSSYINSAANIKAQMMMSEDEIDE